MSWLVLKLVSRVCRCHSVAVYWPLGVEFGGSPLSSSKASVGFFKYPLLCILSLLAVPPEKSRSEQSVRTGKQQNSPESKVWFWTTQSGTGGLKRQAYSEFQSLGWMVQKNPCDLNTSGPEAHNSACLLVRRYSLLPLETIPPGQRKERCWRALSCLCPRLCPLLSVESPGLSLNSLTFSFYYLHLKKETTFDYSAFFFYIFIAICRTPPKARGNLSAWHI